MLSKLVIPSDLTHGVKAGGPDALVFDIARLRDRAGDLDAAIARALEYERVHRAEALAVLESDVECEDIAEVAKLERMTAVVIRDLTALRARIADPADTGPVEMPFAIRSRIFRNRETAA